MIEAKELRIGNWVSHEGKPYQVKELGDGYLVLASSPNDYEVTYEDVEGILLTPEILERIEGAEKVVDSEYRLEYSLAKSLWVWVQWHKKEQEFYITVSGASIVRKKLFVHELQNIIYALTSTELTIKL